MLTKRRHCKRTGGDGGDGGDAREPIFSQEEERKKKYKATVRITPNAPHDPATLRVALRLARRGFRVFPLFGITGLRCDCGKPIAGHGKWAGKHPRTSHGFYDATADLDTIRRWWRWWENANLAIRTGDGLLVIDVDEAEGERSLRALGKLPETVEVTTGRGRHLYFRTDRPAPSTSGRLGPGIDTRGERGYIIAPPSLHYSGTRYRWVHAPWDTEMAEVPSSIISILCAVSPGTRRHGGADGARRNAKPHKGKLSRKDRDWSRSGRDRLRAIELVQQGLNDDEIFEELSHTSEKYLEKLDQDDELIADDYLERTIASARAFDDRGRTVAVIERAEQDISYPVDDKPFRARVWMILRTREGERVKATMVVPSADYPQARPMFDAVAPDLDAAALYDLKRWRLPYRLKGRELDVVVVDGQVRWMRWRRD